MIRSSWTNSEGWPMRLFANSKNVSVACSRPKDSSIDKYEWTDVLRELTDILGHLQEANISGRIAVSCVLSEFNWVVEQGGIHAISYVQDKSDEPVYIWPEISSEEVIPEPSGNRFSHLPFADHRWKPIDVYRGNFGTVGNVEFNPINCLFVRKHGDVQQWFVLLESWVSEQGNDAVLQKMPLIEVFPDQRYKAYDLDDYLENAAGGGDYDWIISKPTVSARGDIIAILPNHSEFTEAGTFDRYVVIVLDESRKTFDQAGSFLSTDHELIAVGEEIKNEVMRNGSDDLFEVITGSLNSHGFSDIQLDVENQLNKSNIIGFKRLDKSTGHIIEYKQYGKDKNKVSLREAHVLGKRTIFTKKNDLDESFLVTTSDLIYPIKTFYDNIWMLESEAYNEAIWWLRTFKSLKEGLYL